MSDNTVSIPRVRVSPMARAKLQYFAELGGNRLVLALDARRIDEEHEIRIEDVLLPKQDAGRLVTLYYFDSRMEDDSQHRGAPSLHWRSSGAFAPLFSETDEREIEYHSILRDGDWLVSVVSDRSGAYVARLDRRDRDGNQTTIRNVEILGWNELSEHEPTRRECERLFAERVTLD